ncbi:ataxin-7-like protein 3 isoform X2 [Hydra vulgaris]|uniref:SAGA-associated factor 11 homolog n=1 Tax=Hydra vulgaris TaxID=6087 RepID=A0ABM4CVG9_HYDVU
MQFSTKEFTIGTTLSNITINHVDEPLIQYLDELIDICTLGVCFEIHRSLRLGCWFLDEAEESRKEYEIVDAAGLDVFGQQPVKKQQECICPNCARTLAASRFAPHLEKCMGMGRNSSRIASRRLQATGRIDDFDADELDYDWNYEIESKSKKNKRERDTKVSPKRNKYRKVEIGLSSLVTHANGMSRPDTPCSTLSGELIGGIKNGPTIQALESLGQEEKVALLTQTCGAISEHTGKMCTRTGKCVQHTDEQRKSVRGLLLGDTDDIPWPASSRPDSSALDQDDVHVDVDGCEDIDEGALLRELTPLPWEQDSNISAGSESTSASLHTSPVIKKKTSNARKNRFR